MRPIDRPTTERRFSALVTAIFVALARCGMVKGSATQARALGLLALGFGILSPGLPQCSAPLNPDWFKRGLLMGRVISLSVLGTLFFGHITHVGCISRWFGRKALRLRRHDRPSHRVGFELIGPAPDACKKPL